MSKSFEQIVQEYQVRVTQDISVEEVIQGLHDEGLTIIQSIKAVRTLYTIGLGEAKVIVAAHPVWTLLVRANEPFQEELVKFFSKDESQHLPGENRE